MPVGLTGSEPDWRKTAVLRKLGRAGFVHFAALAAFRVVDGAMLPTRCENVDGERVVLSFHGRDSIFDFADRLSQLLKGIVKPSPGSQYHTGRRGHARV